MSERKVPTGRYLVTGGAGFIGSHLCEKLLQSGSQVVAVDNLITGNLRNLKNFENNPKFELIRQDITGRLEILGNFDGIFHLASPASPVDYAEFPIETLRVGSYGSEHVLEMAKKSKCRVLVASTSEIYGDPQQHPQKESYWGNVNSIGPRSCYDESKRFLEALTMAYHRVFGLQTRIIRIFNTYGPRMRENDGRVVPNFCMQALRGESITIYGEGKQTRSFCYVSDLVEGILATFLGDSHLPINLGNPTEFTIADFAKKIIALTGSRSELVHKPLPEDDPQLRCPDITKARTELNWEPKVPIDEGLAKTIEYFRQLV
ncbi:MAG: SDR family oxidoreductase [Bdellovibrionales bacterium]|nr:SDR family oxidoreductase [Bdellovibrionales bacterium]